MRLIPGKTKVQIELFKGITLTDIIIGFVAALLMGVVLTSTLPGQLIIILVIVIVTALLVLRLDGEPNYMFVLHMLVHLGATHHYKRARTDAMLIDPEHGEDGVSPEELHEETKEERKARLKAEKEEYQRDEKILKAKGTTKEEADAIWLKRAQQSAARKASRKAKSAENAADMGNIVGFTGIHDNYIDYNGEYYGAVIEISPVEFRFFSAMRRNNSIENGIGRLLRIIDVKYSANIVKLERPVLYDEYIELEKDKVEELRKAYEAGFITEEEFKSRAEILASRLDELNSICFEQKVLQPFYYLVLYDDDKGQLESAVETALDNMRMGEISAERLGDRELAIFLKYTNQIDFDEREIDKVAPEDYAEWAMPDRLDINYNNTVVNGMVAHTMRVVNYASLVGDAWLAGVMSMPCTKVVVKCRPLDKAKSISVIDRSLQELRVQEFTTNVDSKRIEYQTHIESLSALLATLQADNESLLEVNIYVTAYDVTATKATVAGKDKDFKSAYPEIKNLKRMLRRTYQEQNLRLNGMDFDQTRAFIGSQITGWDPMRNDGRGIPSNTVAAMYPWIFAHVKDQKGVKLGMAESAPVFVDFYRRDSERVNSNVVIVGKSGSGKSFATKTILANLAADDSKIFILDPENEYSELASNLHGKFINVGNAQHGRLNPFHIITALDDDEAEEGETGNSYATHLQFLEEFMRQILPDCEKDAMEYLNSLIDRMYMNKGITERTDLSKLRPEDYPTFDDLYDAILLEFQSSDNEFIKTMLRTLMNYVQKFANGGRNAAIWNGPSSITTEENFTVFNFQSLLANRNNTVANAQMLLVLKYIDNEIIKNRDYNLKYGLNRKVIVVIDEAHVFIDTKFPVALDFMFQLAKRIRKYNGMQMVITQNIKDFVGSEEIARKSTAIINACQYSFIFSLAPNDMEDLCRLYQKSGGINENEQDQIVNAPRGQVFAIMSAHSRTTFNVQASNEIVDMFRRPDHVNAYFDGEKGEEAWEDFIGNSRENRITDRLDEAQGELDEKEEDERRRVFFTEIFPEDVGQGKTAPAGEPAPAEDDFAAEEFGDYAEEDDLGEGVFGDGGAQDDLFGDEGTIADLFGDELSGDEDIGEEMYAADYPDAEVPADELFGNELFGDADEDELFGDTDEDGLFADADEEDDFVIDTEDGLPDGLSVSELFAATGDERLAPPAVMPAGDTAAVLSQLLDKFSYDTMVGEIRRSVKEALETELPSGNASAAGAPVSGALPIGNADVDYENDEEDLDLDSLFDFDDEEGEGEAIGNLFGLFDDEEGGEGDEDGESSGAVLGDIFDLTDEEMERYGGNDDYGEEEADEGEAPAPAKRRKPKEEPQEDRVSALEEMLASEETTKEITLDDLMLYHKKNGIM